ncbi:MAG: 50S ribosomal protein L25/general stress protein Ctc [Oscillospiraceae bacterium]
MDLITVEKRNETMKAKQLRRSGIVPCVVYGGALETSLAIQMDKATMNKLFHQKREGSKIILKLDDLVIPVQIKAETRDHMGNEILHVSFQALQADQKVNSVIHIILQNTDKITGSLEKMLLAIPYAALPGDMIDTVTVDLDAMQIGSIVTVADIPELQNDKITLQVELTSIVFRISDKKGATLENAE